MEGPSPPESRCRPQRPPRSETGVPGLTAFLHRGPWSFLPARVGMVPPRGDQR